MQRRDFVKSMATIGALALFPIATACGPKHSDALTEADALPPLPLSKPDGWDPVAYNKERGAAGAIPKKYMGSINGPDGDNKHLGKHLPYVPTLDGVEIPSGFLAIMFGDTTKGHARHPNAARSDSKPEGHWYNSIRLRKATDGAAEELESTYPEWPGTPEMAQNFAVFGGGDILEDGGRNTIHLVALPADVKPGDTVRLHGHCLTHGEYVDFVTV